MSRFGEDLFGPLAGDAVDGSGTDQAAIVGEGVPGAAAAITARRGDRGPGGVETVAAERADTFVDGAGDDPLDGVPVVGAVDRLDDHRAGVLDVDRVDAVHRVGADDAGAVDDRAAGNGAADQRGEQSRQEQSGESTGTSEHGADRTDRPGVPRWAKVTITAVALLLGAAVAFVIIQPITVLPRIGLAPGYSFTDQAGERFTSEDARGSITLVNFAPTDCSEECAAMEATMREVAERAPTEVDLGDVDFTMVTIALDTDPAADDLRRAAERSGADGDTWRWVGGGETMVRTVVGSGFERFYETRPDGSIRFDPGFVLVDGNGVIRGQYRYQTLSSDADKLVSHLGILGTEIRYGGGAASVAYEAAHLFLCYP